MKRHVQLQPLSRQHHNGLLMAMLLTKGLKNNASPEVMCDFISGGWRDELKEHFEMEESVLIPALEKKSLYSALTSQLLEEHCKLRLLIQKAIDHSATANDISDFASLLEKHIRFEEKIYFPLAEKALNETELIQIGSLLREDRSKNCMNYPDKFWE